MEKQKQEIVIANKIQINIPQDLSYVPCGRIDFQFESDGQKFILSIVSNNFGIKEVLEKNDTEKKHK
ncbi:MAG: hypothetical protein ABIK33_03970, partial [candidate division WOR-3 bacterium]